MTVRIRTINEAAAYFKAADPHTALTKTAVRRLVKTGAVPSAKVGTKYLVSLEALSAYLAGERPEEALPAGGIRKVIL